MGRSVLLIICIVYSLSSFAKGEDGPGWFIEDMPYYLYGAGDYINSAENHVAYVSYFSEDEETNNAKFYESCGRAIRIPLRITHVWGEVAGTTEGTDLFTRTYPVKGIRPKAFKGCYQMTSITLPSSIEEICSYAFEGCSGITDIDIPEGVNKIQEGTFKNCTSLSNITLCEGLEEIEAYAFENCTSLISVEIPSTVKKIGASVFKGCINLKKIILHNGIEVIESGAFDDCENLETINIPGTVKSIPASLFSGLGKLKNVALEEGILNMGALVFKDCTSLESLTIPSSMKIIYNDMIEGCTSLEQFIISDCEESLKIAVNCRDYNRCFFTDCPLKTIVLGRDIEYNATYFIKSINSIEEVFVGKYVTDISPNYIIWSGNIKGVYISDLSAWCNLKTGNYDQGFLYSNNPLSFAKKLYLNGELIRGDIVIPNTVTSLTEGCFYGCSEITSVTLPKNLTLIGSNAFAECTNLKSIIIPENVETICAFAFYGCDALETVTLPDDIEEIHSGAFRDCKSLKSIVPKSEEANDGVLLLPKSLHKIGALAFWGCEKINSVKIKGPVKKIEDGTFTNCSSLEFVDLGDDVEEIRNNAFNMCVNLKTVNLPATIKYLRENAFARDPDGREVDVYIKDIVTWCNIGFGNLYSTSLGTKLYVNDKLIKNLRIPDGVATIKSWSFINVGSINSIILPNPATDVKDWSLNAWITTIYVPKELVDDRKSKWPYYAGRVKAMPTSLTLSDDQDATKIEESLQILDYPHTTSINLSEAQLADDVTYNLLTELDGLNPNCLIYLPSGETIIGNNTIINDMSENVVFNATYDINIEKDFNAKSINYTLPIPYEIDDVTTLCLPYDYILPDGLAAYTLENEDASGNLMFEKVESGIIEANKPYLVKASQNIDNLNASNVTIKSTESINAGIDGYEFVGTLSAISAAEAVSMGAYTLSDNNEWLPMTEDSEGIKPGTAFLIPTSSSPNKIKSILFTPTVKNVIAIISYILGESPDDFDATAADLNGDGEVTITDASILMNMIGK